jgi:hypothetical protein
VRDLQPNFNFDFVGPVKSVKMFPVLRLVSDARNAHGLRLQDPKRYNAYCAKRVLSVKRAVRFIHRGKSKAPPKQITADMVAQDTR